MRRTMILAALLVGVCWLMAASSFSSQSETQTAASPQACSADTGVVTSVKQDLSTLVDTIKKESQDDFNTKYHQQTCESRLSICLEMTNQLVDCLDKATKDASTPKDQLDAIKTLEATYTKLKNMLDQDLQTLKGVKDPKAAKTDIAAFNFTI